MEKDIVDIVKEKAFIELSEHERAELKEFCATEDEYNHLKHVFMSVEAMPANDPQPKKETKESLDHLFHQVHPKSAPVWYSSVLTVVIPREKPIYRQPLLQAAAVALLVLLAVPLFNSNLTNTSDKLAAVDTELLEEKDEVKADEIELVVDEIDSEDQPEMKEEEIVTNQELMQERNQQSVLAEMSDAEVTSSPVAVASAEPSMSDHPDGVFVGSVEKVSYSIPTNEQPELLDLLTATF